MYAYIHLIFFFIDVSISFYYDAAIVFISLKLNHNTIRPISLGLWMLRFPTDCYTTNIFPWQILKIKTSKFTLLTWPYPLPTSTLSASKCPLKAAQSVGVIPSSSLALQSFFVASFSIFTKPSWAALKKKKKNHYYRETLSDNSLEYFRTANLFFFLLSERTINNTFLQSGRQRCP